MQLKLKLKIFNLNDETKFYKITANKRQSRNKACRYRYILNQSSKWKEQKRDAMQPIFQIPTNQQVSNQNTLLTFCD